MGLLVLVSLFFLFIPGLEGGENKGQRERKIRETFLCADRELGALGKKFDLWKQSSYSYYIPVVYDGKGDERYFSAILYDRVIKQVGGYDWMILSLGQTFGEYRFVFLKEGRLMEVCPYIKIPGHSYEPDSCRFFRDWLWSIASYMLAEKELDRKWNALKELEVLWRKNWFEECQLQVTEKKLPEHVYKKLNEVMTMFKEQGRVEGSEPLGVESWKDLCYFSYRMNFDDLPEFYEEKLFFFGNDSHVFGYLPPVDARVYFYPFFSCLNFFNHLSFAFLSYLYGDENAVFQESILESCDDILSVLKQRKRVVSDDRPQDGRSFLINE